MHIKVTQHAIERYRERLFDYSSSKNEIIRKLSEIAQHGKVVGLKPGYFDNCYEFSYKEVSIVAVEEKAQLIIVTCLGDICYRKWVKAQNATYASQRILYPGRLLQA